MIYLATALLSVRIVPSGESVSLSFLLSVVGFVNPLIGITIRLFLTYDGVSA